MPIARSNLCPTITVKRVVSRLEVVVAIMMET